MFKMDLKKEEEPEIKLPTNTESSKKQGVPGKHLLLIYWLAKDFDCVDQNKLWKILKHMGIPDHLTCILRNLYGHGTTDWFQIGRGVHQGCIYSLCLFSLYAESVQSHSHVGLWVHGCSTPGLPVQHKLSKFTQTHIHWCHTTISSFVIPFFSNWKKFLSKLKEWINYSMIIAGELLHPTYHSVQFSRSVMSHSVNPWTAARQASLSIPNSQNPPKLMSIETVMPSNHRILCNPLILLPAIFPSIRVFFFFFFLMSQLFASGGQVLEFQLQHQSFHWTPRIEL